MSLIHTDRSKKLSKQMWENRQISAEQFKIIYVGHLSGSVD